MSAAPQGGRTTAATPRTGGDAHVRAISTAPDGRDSTTTHQPEPSHLQIVRRAELTTSGFINFTTMATSEMSDEHRAASAKDRTEGKAVRAFLEGCAPEAHARSQANRGNGDEPAEPDRQRTHRSVADSSSGRRSVSHKPSVRHGTERLQRRITWRRSVAARITHVTHDCVPAPVWKCASGRTQRRPRRCR